MGEIKVEKKDGRLEDFDLNKVKRGIVKAGVSPEETESIAAQINTWAQTTAVNGVIKSSDIRTKVLELLRSTKPAAAASFEQYRKGAKQPA